MRPIAAGTKPEQTVAERIEHSLALDVLRGTYEAGGKLPSLRTLARTWGTTLPTVQRVVERLAARGFVDPRRGSGVVVLDVRRSTGLSSYPLRFEALSKSPDSAAALLQDFLELRRVVLVHLLTRHREALLTHAPTLLSALTALNDTDSAVSGRARADLDLSRALVEAVGNHALSTVVNTVEALVLQTPWVAEALYGDTAAHDRLLAGLATELFRPEGASAQRLEVIVETFDSQAVLRYRDQLAALSTTQGEILDR